MGIDKFVHIPMKIGRQEYLGGLLDVETINTMFNGLCFKMNFSNPLPTSFQTSWIIIASSKDQDLKKIQLTIAAGNTWQGIIQQTWPYNNIPLVISKKFSSENVKQTSVKIHENLYKNRNGITDFDECFNDQPTSQCLPIFDPRPIYVE